MPEQKKICQKKNWGGVCSGGSAIGWVSALRGVSALRDVCSGGVWSRGVSALGGVWSEGGVWSRGCLPMGGCLLHGGICSKLVSAPGGGGIPACTEADTPLWTESQMPVKTLPWPNFVAAGNKLRRNLSKTV